MQLLKYSLALCNVGIEQGDAREYYHPWAWEDLSLKIDERDQTISICIQRKHLLISLKTPTTDTGQS